MQLIFWSSILKQIIIHSFCLLVLAGISKLICMGQLLTVHTLLMIVLRELWNVTKVRETTIIINRIIYRKKPKVSWSNTSQGPLMMTTYVYGKMKKKTNKKKLKLLGPKDPNLAQLTSLVWGLYIPKLNYHFNHCFFYAKKNWSKVYFSFFN